jgi:hypothetical protein
MATEVSATSLFRGPDLGVCDDAVLRHEGGVITDVSAGAGAASGPRSLGHSGLRQRA